MSKNITTGVRVTGGAASSVRFLACWEDLIKRAKAAGFTNVRDYLATLK